MFDIKSKDLNVAASALSGLAGGIGIGFSFNTDAAFNHLGWSSLLAIAQPFSIKIWMG